ncbi:hypothetical protein [Rothia uropygialis]|uniref:hypothetical protein n=1 Tax=Kocuria sp. 36 TaxID=1415402 RepID=UPI00101BBC6A|nr:hypothetical protein [Kocuria sp. 36]
MIYGDRGRAEGLLSEVGGQNGYSGMQYGMFSADNVMRSMGRTPLVAALVSSIGIILFSLCSSILLGSRRYARKRLYGASPWELFKHDIADIAVPLLGSIALTTTLSGIFLKIYNDLAFATLFFLLGAAILDLLVVVCLAFTPPPYSFAPVSPFQMLSRENSQHDLFTHPWVWPGASRSS